MDLLTGTVVPAWVMAVVVGVLTISLLIGVPLARSAGARRGRRLAHPELYTSAREKAKDTALFLAALLPSLLVWLAVMGVSFIGLTGFARSVLQWDHWSNMLVPLSLDGISVSFGAWAFVAVKRGRHPGRAYKIVLAAATMSAVLNFVHGRSTWSIWAGLYLAFLSFAGMAMFHELLEQFMAGYEDESALKSRYPRFGQRWLYAPLSTFSARRAWIVHPPSDGLRATTRNALSHLESVREQGRQRRLGGAVRVREEQAAKLVEIQARNEVRAARRGQLVEMPDWAMDSQEWPIEQADWQSEPVPPPAWARVNRQQFVVPAVPAPATDHIGPSAVAAVAERVEEAAPQADADDVFGRLRMELAQPAPVEAQPVPDDVVEALDFALAPEMSLQDRVSEILDAYVRTGDELAPDALAEVALRMLAAPANRDEVRRRVVIWVREIEIGDRAYGDGPRWAPAQQPVEVKATSPYPFEVLALRRLIIGSNVVACPGCGTEASLVFSGMHPRRPVEANCGCGQRWPIVGLGSTRVWDVLAGELAAGQAERLPV